MSDQLDVTPDPACQLDVTPDPAWDYYVTWHSLLNIKARIGQALEMINDFEEGNAVLDQEIRDELYPILNSLQQVIDSLPPDEPD
ncbi:MAG: hypothetical protein QNJ51_25625 [Calothrix sp. MO_167.B12]|nr:hypothetical protein [Calothrix sp. MO_167.B12]